MSDDPTRRPDPDGTADQAGLDDSEARPDSAMGGAGSGGTGQVSPAAGNTVPAADEVDSPDRDDLTGASSDPSDNRQPPERGGAQPPAGHED